MSGIRQSAARHARLPSRRQGPSRARARRHPRALPRPRLRRDRDARHGGVRPASCGHRRRQREARLQRAQARSRRRRHPRRRGRCRQPRRPRPAVRPDGSARAVLRQQPRSAAGRVPLHPDRPVWRAERPQKGRYRQFLQCDIDIIGDASARAEAELVVATLDTTDALGLEGGSVRINDRRVLDWMLDSFGFGAEERPGVLITIDKLDKIGPDGIVAELRERGPRPRPSTRSRPSCAAR